jgi:putative addiction module killer protein
VEAKPRTVEVYIAANGTAPFDDGMDGLRDTKGKGQIDSRIGRLERGLLGHYRDIGDGLIELKLDNAGPGYRIYCADNGESVLILCAGPNGHRTPILPKRNTTGVSLGDAEDDT